MISDCARITSDETDCLQTMKLFKLLLLCCLVADYVDAVFEVAVAGVGIASLMNSRRSIVVKDLL